MNSELANLLGNDGQKAFNEFLETFISAEDYLKKVEATTYSLFKENKKNGDLEGIFIAPVNELRYAGRHIVDFFNEEHFSQDSLESARRHTHRARYDAMECIFKFYLAECRDFQETYQNIVIGEIITDYGKLCNEIQIISKNIPTSHNTSDYFNIMSKSIDRLIEIYSIFNYSRDSLNKKLKKERQTTIYNWIGFIFTIISLVLAILAFFF